jgi:hypothetical protein
MPALPPKADIWQRKTNVPLRATLIHINAHSDLSDLIRCSFVAHPSGAREQ